MANVFLSYAHSDYALAAVVAQALEQAGVRTEVGISAIQPGATLASQLTRAIQMSDVMIVLLTPAAISSQGVETEISVALSADLDRRGVDLIPVLAEPTTVPPALGNRAVINLTNDRRAGLRQLVEQVQASLRIDFSSLSPRSFEALVLDLLKTIGLEASPSSSQRDAGIDIKARYERVDPFGVPETEMWLVEAKHYSQQRVSVDTIRQLAGVLATANGPTRGLLVTNTQLTSVAREYIAELDRSPHVRIRVLDGLELRRLLRQFPEVAARHFSGNDSSVRGDD